MLQASGIDLTPAFRVGADGALGLSTASAARLTVSGVGDAGDLAAELRGGDLWPATSNYQLTFGYAGGALYRHSIRSQHAVTQSSNSLRFFLWTPPDTSTALGSAEALRLVSHSTGATVHVLPPVAPAISTTTVELAVSDGLTLGAGRMHVREQQTGSSALIKDDIRPLGPEAEVQAYEDVRSLRHVRFRYKRAGGKPQRGLLADEAPESVRAGEGTVSLDRRLLNTELAARELLRKLAVDEADAAALGGGRP
ncbi:MAG: tail fiber domain-containing protein [Elusimicrobia bacterium]|nr:tail fiber domain-containing protein [Elusimicrobiota bacterium]